MDAPEIFDRQALERLRRIGGAELALQMIALFREAAPTRLREAREGLAAGDLRALERAGHALISSAGNVGATELLEAARALEGTAAADPPDLAALVSRVEDACARVERPLADYERELGP